MHSANAGAAASESPQTHKKDCSSTRYCEFALFSAGNPMTTDTILDSVSTTGTISVPGSIAGTIDALPMTGSSNTSFDHDWYRMTLIAGHQYDISAVGTSGTLNDVAIDLRDANGNLISSVFDGGVNGTASFGVASGTTGTFYLAISAGGNNPASLTGSYSINVVEEPIDTVLDNTSTTATLSVPGAATGIIDPVPMSGSSNTSFDHDWWRVTLTAGHQYTFSATGASDTPLNDIAIDLRDSSGNLLTNVVDGGTNGTASFAFTPSTPGTFYLTISAGGSNPGRVGGYSISAADNGISTVDAVPKDASTNFVLTTSSPVNGTIDAADVSGAIPDKDWYKVSLQAGHSYHFFTSANVSNLDTLGCCCHSPIRFQWAAYTVSTF